MAAFERLGNVLFDVANPSEAKMSSVSAVLDFSLDDEGRPRVRGTCKVVAPICCCRCAETVDVEVESQLDFRVVATEAEAEGLMPAVDAVVSEAAHLPLTALLEDDILLSVPERCCGEDAPCAYADRALLTGHAADLSEAKPLAGLQALVEGRGPA